MKCNIPPKSWRRHRHLRRCARRLADISTRWMATRRGATQLAEFRSWATARWRPRWPTTSAALRAAGRHRGEGAGRVHARPRHHLQQQAAGEDTGRCHQAQVPHRRATSTSCQAHGLNTTLKPRPFLRTAVHRRDGRHLLPDESVASFKLNMIKHATTFLAPLQHQLRVHDEPAKYNLVAQDKAVVDKSRAGRHAHLRRGWDRVDASRELQKTQGGARIQADDSFIAVAASGRAGGQVGHRRRGQGPEGLRPCWPNSPRSRRS